jgi:hypothetical protein
MPTSLKISQLPAAGSLTGTELTAIATGGQNYAATVNQLKAVSTDGITILGDGTSSSPLSAAGGPTGWSLLGNAGTTSSNFLGTVDNEPLRLKVNNSLVGYFDSANVLIGSNQVSGGTRGIGIGNPISITVIKDDDIIIGSGGTAAAYTSGSKNIIITNDTVSGVSSLSTGSSNVLLGTGLFDNITSGSSNILIGGDGGVTNGSGNIAIGETTGITTSSNSIIIGTAAAGGNDDSIVIGHRASASNLGCIAIGSGAGAATNSTSVGYRALTADASGGNTAVGYQALINLTSSAAYNTAIGYNAGVGAYSGFTLSTALGANTQAGWNNSTAIGANSITVKNNQMLFGSGVVHWTFPSMQAYANNAAAVSAGLATGDLYYTNVAGDGIVKIVI